MRPLGMRIELQSGYCSSGAYGQQPSPGDSVGLTKAAWGLSPTQSARHIWVVLFLLPVLSVPPAHTATLSDIRHVVIILKENHTFDNYFGSFPGADGATSGRRGDRITRLSEAPIIPPADLPHGRGAAVSAWDGGEMDDFTYPLAYSEYFERDIPIYWSYARQYVLADRFFTSVMGPSFPNHLSTIFGTSFNAVNNPFHSSHLLDAFNFSH